MIVYVSNESTITFEFDIYQTAEKVIAKVLEEEKCPYQVEVNILLTDKKGIQKYNQEMRGIDKVTDVLSFPGLYFEEPSLFQISPQEMADYVNPESGNIVLGDIVICADKVLEQANEYGHSRLREFAFLIAHSMYHLCGYDHMTPQEAVVMEEKQEKILQLLQITRDLES
ncbi:MAG: rRNA maturation RNase YbeY [Lachnospiraceae bacterium]|nr:rRNA maturation RNase YbeY [Lachnospiraceae bacterium]